MIGKSIVEVNNSIEAIARMPKENMCTAEDIRSAQNYNSKCYCDLCRFATKYRRKNRQNPFDNSAKTIRMPKGSGLILSLLLVSLLSTVSARNIPVPPSIEGSQDVYRLLDNLQERDPKALTYMKDLALLLEKLKQQPMEAMQQSDELLPEPLAMQGRIPSMQETPREDKRGSYMALCHFKICNMGRKRGYSWNSWNRA